MRIVLFCHSLRSDWNHGNAHFLRGVVTDLVERGHRVEVYEPADGWSATNLIREHGTAAVERARAAYPSVRCVPYRPEELDLDRALEGVDAVLVHEWSDPDLVRRVGEVRARRPEMRLLFHDTHHRAATHPEEMAAYDLRHYDGVLAFGRVIRDIYLRRGWAREVWVWHEAADTRVFRPRPEEPDEGDLVWIGNWGDEERTRELEEFLLQPARELGLEGRAYGVRYPEPARAAFERAGLRVAGWLPNFEAPGIYARFRMTVHVPRAPYARALPGVPTIRVFEALACGIPLLSAPWEDEERLFTPGRDFLMARDGAQMKRAMRLLLHEPDVARGLAASGLRTVLARHRCTHRVAELLHILGALGLPAALPAAGGVRAA